MWLYAVGAILGIAVIITGIALVKNKKQKKWHILTVCGALLSVFCLFLFICGVLLLGGTDNDPVASSDIHDGTTEDNDIVGNDWRTFRSYSGDYYISDRYTVCFSMFDDQTGFGVYDSESGSRIGSIIVPEEMVVSSWDIELGDIDGNGTNDVSVPVDISGTAGTIWFLLDENSSDLFTLYDEISFPVDSQNADDTDIFLRTKGIWRFGGELDTASICMDGLGNFQAYYANGVLEEEGYLEYVDEYEDGNGRYDMYSTDGEFFAGFYFDSDTAFHVSNEDDLIYLLDVS